MIRLLAAVLLLAYSHFGWASAYPEDYSGVPHGNFQEGDVIDHTEFNQNNSSIKEAINDRVPVPSNCSADQIIKYDGGGWVCTDMPEDGADGVAAGLACDTNQIIKWDGSSEAWVCANLSGPQLETVYVDCTEGFATPDICRAICPDGKQLVSGGCIFNYLNQATSLMSIPEGISWSCGIGNGGAGSHVDSAYAICQ